MFDKKTYARQYSIDNKEELAKYKRQYRIDNKEKITESMRKYRKKHQEKKKEYMKEYYQDNKERIKDKVKEWRENNPEKCKENRSRWKRENSKKIKLLLKNRGKTDIKFNLNHRIRAAIRLSLKGNKAGRHWEDLVGYTLNELKTRLTSTLPKGYTWQDFLEGKLHVDHKVPISAWDYDKPEQINFQRCWSLKNLRLLPAKENLIKGSKLLRPFQPVLKI